jgi:hypothetical protein
MSVGRLRPSLQLLPQHQDCALGARRLPIGSIGLRPVDGGIGAIRGYVRADESDIDARAEVVGHDITHPFIDGWVPEAIFTKRACERQL